MKRRGLGEGKEKGERTGLERKRRELMRGESCEIGPKSWDEGWERGDQGVKESD